MTNEKQAKIQETQSMTKEKTTMNKENAVALFSKLLESKMLICVYEVNRFLFLCVPVLWVPVDGPCPPGAQEELVALVLNVLYME